MTLTDELGDVPPPPHAWMAPVVDDMLQEARAGLTEAVVHPGYASYLRGTETTKVEGLWLSEDPNSTMLGFSADSVCSSPPNMGHKQYFNARLY